MLTEGSQLEPGSNQYYLEPEHERASTPIHSGGSVKKKPGPQPWLESLRCDRARGFEQGDAKE